MPYAVRNSQGQVTSLHRHDPGVGDWVENDDPEVRQFLGLEEADDGLGTLTTPEVEGPNRGAAEGFNRLDADFIRVLEDVIDALTSRNLLNITDLPDIAQTKLFARRSFRERRPKHALDLFRPGDLDNVL
jgi:hypothetical protein